MSAPFSAVGCIAAIQYFKTYQNTVRFGLEADTHSETKSISWKVRVGQCHDLQLFLLCTTCMLMVSLCYCLTSSAFPRKHVEVGGLFNAFFEVQ